MLLLAIAWCAAALWFDGPANRWWAGMFAGGLVIGCCVILLQIRPYWRALWWAGICVVAVVGWWLLIPPSNDRDWYPEVARQPYAEIDGNQLRIYHLRNFDYQSETDFTEQWETREYDLDKLVGVDLFLSYWGPRKIAHTITSWEFADGSHLAISIETRKEKGESYSAVRGFFRQFEIYYVVADERDVIRLRTNYRGEQVFLYRLNTPPEHAKTILLDYIREINELAEQARWYNALSHNCTSAIRYHAQHVGLARPLDWRIFANGYLDELGYERGSVDRSLPFEELRRRSDITEQAKAADLNMSFYRQIREGLPGRPLVGARSMTH
jgi:hypothetical protein